MFDASSLDSALGEVVGETARVVCVGVRKIELVGHVDDVRDSVGLHDEVGAALVVVNRVDLEDSLQRGVAHEELREVAGGGRLCELYGECGTVRLRRLRVGVVAFGGGDGGGSGGLAWEGTLLKVVSAIAAIAAAGPVQTRAVLCGHPSWRLLATAYARSIRPQAYWRDFWMGPGGNRRRGRGWGC